MAALVQSYPQQSSTVTMLQTRPSSASGILQGTSQGQGHHQYPSGHSQMHLNGYGINGVGQTTYRGQTSMVPGAPYPFVSTSGLSINSLRPQQGPYHRADLRASSAPVIPIIHAIDAGHASNRSRYPAGASVSTSSSSEPSVGIHHNVSRDDSAITSTAWVATRVPQLEPTIISSVLAASLPAANPPTPAKAAPDRYRRPVTRRSEATRTSPATQQLNTSSPTFISNSGIAGSNEAYSQSSQSNSQSMGGYQGFTQAPYFSSSNNSNIAHFSQNLALRSAADDMQLRRQPAREEAARYRRRSIHITDLGDQADAQLYGMVPQGQQQGLVAQEYQHPLRSSPVLSNRPASSPGRTGGSDAILSARGNQAQQTSAAKRDPNVLIAPGNPTPASTAVEEPHLKYDQPILVNIPPRSSSSDAAKRVTNSSPLSKPMTMNAESPVSKDSFASTVSAALQVPSKATYAQVAQGTRPQSPAAKQLAALSEKEGRKSKPSRLRRAFSFGSAAELRKVTESSDASKAVTGDGADRARLRKERYQDEREAEQARIARQQEEAGIGQSIYSSQGNIFSGSTDNLSISSTASSASIMIRKMGQGMKKTTRSLVGLFRPKSVVGVPPAQSVPQPSEAQVSMITVEAERESINIDTNLHNQVGGETRYPALERNSVDVEASISTGSHERTSSSDSTPVRKSIIGGEKERAEVLAAVKKGILKRSATDSPSASPIVLPIDNKTLNFNLPIIPNVNDSPSSSAPSTPNDDPHEHKRTNSVTIGEEDYFMSALKLSGDTKSVPNTPPSGIKRNATFSPRIQFHDTWPSGEYDRRGEIATCNRLTPMLAQQIKEELNTFKMEMEVHENSKIYTHFF